MGRCLTQEAKFLVLNKKSAWDRGLSINLDVADDGLKISKSLAYVLDLENEIEVLADKFRVTDFAVARRRQLYILDDASPAIWIYDTNLKQIEKIACIDKLFKQPKSIAYAAGTLYVADAAADERIFALSDSNWQIKFATGAAPQSDALSVPLPFVPVDLAVDDEGNLFALDGNNLAILKFNAAAQLVDVFGQSDLQNKQPVNIALSREGFIYVLDLTKGKKAIWKFPTSGSGDRPGEILVDLESLSGNLLPTQFAPSGFAVDSRGILYVGDHGDPAARLANQEESLFIRKFDAKGKYLGVVEDFRGVVDQLVVDEDNSIFVFSAEEKNKITALRQGQRFAQLEGATLVKGRHFSKALDSGDAGTIWHKLTSVTTAPPNTQVQVQISFLAADQKAFKIGAAEQDLDEFLAETAKLDVTTEEGKAEQQSRLADLDKLNWSRPVVNSNDALIAATGRFIWTRIELIGGELASPSIQSLRVDYPRISYLRYLPAVYQEEERGRDFLERFLSLFETFFGGLETQVDRIARYFDPDSSVAGGEFLRWLSTWLAVSVDNSWDDKKLRALIKRASEIYRYRGTRTAIEEMIELFTGDRPLVVEHFHGSCAAWRDQARDEDLNDLAELYERLYGHDPFCFCVLLKPYPFKTEEQRKAVRRILDLEKPAHTCAGLLTLQPWVQLDTHTYLGINTYLSEPSARLDFGSTIPHDTVLNDPETTGQLERRSRLDLDIKLI